MSQSPLHRAISGDTPKRKHFPKLRPQQPPTSPDICSFTRPSLPHSSWHAHTPPTLWNICQRWPLYKGTGRQTPSTPPQLPSTCTLKHTNSRTGPTASDPAFLTEVEERGGYDKDDSLCGGTLSAAATRNLFRKNRILYTMAVGVKKGGTY